MFAGAVSGDLLRSESGADAADHGDELFPGNVDCHAGPGCNRRHIIDDFDSQLPPLALDSKLIGNDLVVKVTNEGQ